MCHGQFCIAPQTLRNIAATSWPSDLRRPHDGHVSAMAGKSTNLSPATAADLIVLRLSGLGAEVSSRSQQNLG